MSAKCPADVWGDGACPTDPGGQRVEPPLFVLPLSRLFFSSLPAPFGGEARRAKNGGVFFPGCISFLGSFRQRWLRRAVYFSL